MANELEGFWAWLGANGVPLGIIISIVAAGASLIRYWLGRPRLGFSMDDGSKSDAATLAIINIGGREAVDVRVTWVQLSRMEMELFPQPKVIGAREYLRIEFTMTHEDRLLHNLTDAYGDYHSPFGYVLINWRRPIWRASDRVAIVPLGAFGKGQLSTSISTGRVPRTPLKESRLAKWWDRASGRERRREDALAYSQRSGETLQLANALKSIGEAGVILPRVDDEEKVHLVLGELGRRGWEWNYQTVEFGFSVEADKRFFPTTGASVKARRHSLFEAVVIALGMAIESDHDHFERMA